jgi:hypothetical protein
MPESSLSNDDSAGDVRTSSGRRLLMTEAVVCLGLATVALLVLRFRTIASHLGEGLSPAEAARRMAATSEGDSAKAIVHDVGWAVRRAADGLPFPARCLEQALAAKYMLRRRHITGALHLGVAPRHGFEGTMMAHAWLDAAGIEVTGYPVESDFTEVACFI